MRINSREILLIIFCSIFLSFIRYLLLDEYKLLKENRLNKGSSSKVSEKLYEFIANAVNPQLINIDMAKSLYDNNLVTFIDARDLESYNEEHIKGALNLPYDNIEEIIDTNDLLYYLEIGENFNERIKIDYSNYLFFGLNDGNVFIAKDIDGVVDDKNQAFVIYCSGEGCSLSEDLGFYMFDQLGIKKVFIYEGGIPEWKNNNYPIEQ